MLRVRKYKKIFKEEQNSLDSLKDNSIVDKLIEFIKENPYPKDSQLHSFAESLGMDADNLEEYAYAVLSCFIVGGNFNKSEKKESDFDEEEIKMGLIVEAEHVDMKTDNKVVKYIADVFRKRISLDHEADNDKYYQQAKEGKLQMEELK